MKINSTLLLMKINKEMGLSELEAGSQESGDRR